MTSALSKTLVYSTDDMVNWTDYGAQLTIETFSWAYIEGWQIEISLGSKNGQLIGGNYGIRYDQTAWTDENGEHENFTMATAGAVHLEHIMLTGARIIDGPELIWTQCFRETNRRPTTDGYTMRDWETFPQFINVSVDNFRKILDGTVRIPTRQAIFLI